MLTVKRFTKADEVRPFMGHGSVSVLNFGARVVGLATFEPGWKWSVDVAPIAGTKTCQNSHAAYILSGRIHIVMDSGETQDLSAGDVAFISPGHDAWVVGDEACRVMDFGDIREYAAPSPGARPSARGAETAARH
jgi:hypothetical protein